ncbi:cytochrome b [Imhoffiella purpurea]|uniref:Cytochrome B561 n=1 Tax=Imhoffiella purpurea TaxID=1249627 RepID=W9VC52_9GAMM|nr:Cytochrome B561 [Imhoffiella purpurea]
MKNRYTFLQRLTHWLIALMVFGLLLGGLAFWALGYEGLSKMLGEDTAGMLFMYHKSFGILVLALTFLRLWLRRLTPAPAYDPPLGLLERMVGGSIHLLLYLFLIAVPVVGLVATAASGHPIQFFDAQLPSIIDENKELGATLFAYHGLGGLIVAGLLLIHIAAGLKHWKLKDGIMTRISLP